MFDVLAAAWLLASSPGSTPPDSLPSRRIVRQFSPVEVEGSRMADPAAVETVHALSQASMRQLPVGSLRDAVALQPGVVAVGEDLHVRGGRAGEMALSLLGLPLDDPRTGVPFELPLFAVRSAELMTGTMDADRAGSLAGDLELHTEDPTAGMHPRVRWSGDGEQGRNIDVGHAAFSLPLGRTGAGIAVAGEARFDDLGLPNLRSPRSSTLMGHDYGWRNDNHMLAWAKLAPIDRPRRASLELVLNRVVLAPYNPMFTYDGWVTFHENDFDLTAAPEDGSSIHYHAADHAVMTEERRWALVGSVASPGAIPVKLSAGWLHTRTQTSVGLQPGAFSTPLERQLMFGAYNRAGSDPFHAIFGDEPFSLLATSDRAMGRADAVTAPGRNQVLRLGAGADWDRVRFAQVDEAEPIVNTVSTVRTYAASAPAVFAYAQHRWEYSGLMLSDGLRLQRFSAGVGAAGAPPQWSLSPRLGIAFPVSVRDVFSFSYARLAQDPQRDVLYDDRAKAYDRHPLGNPYLEPSEAIAWQAALKHILDAAWSVQASVFDRDVWGEPGARNAATGRGIFTLRYENADEAHATGFEFEVAHTSPGGSRVRAGYTFLNAWGSMSSPDGIAYGDQFGARPVPLGTHPLDWDLRHVLVLEASLPSLPGGWSLGWTTRLASGKPWTPLYPNAGTSGEWPPLYEDESLINTRRLAWTEATNMSLRFSPSGWRTLHVGLMVTNLFDHRGEDRVTLSGYPNGTVNTLYDEYSAYRTATGQGGGAYWNGDGTNPPTWHPVNDPRLQQQPRSIQLEIGLGD